MAIVLFAVVFAQFGEWRARAAGPMVSVSINNSGEASLFRGMPMLVSVNLANPTIGSDDASPLIIAAAIGVWTNSIRLNVLDASGNAQHWPFSSMITPGATIILDNTRSAQVDWWLTPEQTVNLATGSYSITATLDTAAVTLADTWRGIIEPPPANIEIMDEPATLTEAQAENKYSQLAGYELFRKNGTNALNQINQLLANYPTNLAGLRIKAQALDALGRTGEAHDVALQAIESFYARNTTAQEPPTTLFMLESALEETLLNPILHLTVADNQQVTLDWTGHPSLSYGIENSSDLLNWAVYATNFNIASGRFFLTAPRPGDRDFFRLSVGSISSSP
jgi:hypothetical protein